MKTELQSSLMAEFSHVKKKNNRDLDFSIEHDSNGKTKFVADYSQLNICSIVEIIISNASNEHFQI